MTASDTAAEYDFLNHAVVAVPALLDALDAERERVRMLREAIERVEAAYVGKNHVVPVEEATAAWDRLDAFYEALDSLFLALDAMEETP